MRVPAQAWCQDAERDSGVGNVRVAKGVPFRLFLLGIALLLPLLSLQAGGRELVTRNQYKVEAAFLRNFAHYVNWPSKAFAAEQKAWYIGVLGQDPFGDVLEETLAGRREQGRAFEVFRADRLEDLPQCQILFIALNDARRRRAVLKLLRNKPVLTVSEAVGFLGEGGMIRFQVDDWVSMDINLDQARRSMLKIATKMLEVSREILENGKVRHVK